MDLTKESIISFLVAQGGKVEKSDLEAHFKSSVNCVDPAQQDRNRETFKTLVNSVAYVKAIDGTRFVILRKKCLHFLGGSQTTENGNDDRNTDESGEQAPDVQDEKTEQSEGLAASGGNPPSLSPIELALQRSKCEDVKVRRKLNVDVNRKENDEVKAQSKPYGLPLRIPVSSRVEIQKLRVNPEDPPYSQKADTSKTKRKPSSVDSCSPQLRRAARGCKVTEEPKDSRISSMFPLEQLEHEWLVKCAAGQWTHVHGLLLSDCHLAQKKDFTSGFTVLHWVAKCGNSKMLSVVMDMVRERKVNIDINAKSHGGYTPLHIAALHDQEYIMAMLVGEFGANVRIRDNCGNRPCHYLHKGISKTVKEMLTEPKAPTQSQATDPLSQREEQDVLPDLSRGLHSFSRLFQPTVISNKKKPAQRSGLYSLSEDSEEQEASGFRHRVMSNASVC
ncbi:ankyrin repeat domain-containing protein SOWAHA-like [Poeciliopsis prolifica]|uniref:ankyrin repeat domain-containing protein SOWAHA-like n=1 Tax=Poeciliopsis prolifica TaxID=188132 RepID=UPI00241380F8|nr:ankyrin repeat domain-containing protein SOWAHA-like [Poeciliopsis prolifica]